MSNIHPPNHKKQKLDVSNNEDGNKTSEEHVAISSYERESVPIATTTSAVTALALLSDMIVFSGHRDGSICRWNTTTDDQATNDPQKPHRPLPEWIITSACVNLTKHETFGNEEKLGIAGLVVRNNQPSGTSRDSSTADIAATHLLYSWNHQREDMRIEINGIPQKVMIWNATTSERLSALMIDVGRCCHTKMYANPLISCLVFCKLLVPENTNQSAAALSTSSLICENDNHTSSTGTGQSSIVSVWTDAVIVALQATCDAPISNDNDDDNCLATDTTNKETKVATSSLLPPRPPLPQRTVATPTGNIVPFYEQTRKRMSPWMAIGGFVRALAVVGPTTTASTIDDDSRAGYIISVTETTRSPSVPQPQQSTPATDKSTSINAVKEGEGSSSSAQSCSGGQASSIIIWDTACPGTILNVFSLDNGCDKNLLYNQPRFDGNVYALTLSHCHEYLLLSMCMGPTNTGSNCSDRRHVVLRLPSTTRKTTTDITDDTFVLSVCGWYTSSHNGIEASHRGDLIASTSFRKNVDDIIARNDGNIVHQFLTLYSFRDVISTIDQREMGDTELNMTTLSSAKQIDIPTVLSTEPTGIAVGDSQVIVGYENGTIQWSSVPSSMTQVVNNLNTFDMGSIESVSCSAAPIGLHGVPCPHLSSSANNVNLQNKCIIT